LISTASRLRVVPSSISQLRSIALSLLRFHETLSQQQQAPCSFEYKLTQTNEVEQLAQCMKHNIKVLTQH